MFFSSATPTPTPAKALTKCSAPVPVMLCHTGNTLFKMYINVIQNSLNFPDSR